MINLSKISNLTLDKKTLTLIIVGFLVACYIDFSFILIPQLKGLGSLRSKVAKLNNDIKELNNNLNSIKNAKVPLSADVRQDESLRSQRIILEEEVPLLLQEISAMADNYGVNIAQILPIKDAKVSEEDFEGKKFLPIKIGLTMSGGYHSLGGFLWAIEDTNVFVSVGELKIVRQKNNSFAESINLTLKAYVVKK